MRSHGRTGWALGAVSALALVACGSEDKGGNTTTGDTTGGDTFDAVSVFDSIFPDTGTVDTNDGEIVPGGFGAACQGNSSCDSGWCVEGPEGYICTTECIESCPADFDCRSVTNVKGDIVFLCLPRVRKLCLPCLQDFQCQGGGCLEIDGDGMCATACETENDCPHGYGCKPDATGAHEGSFCQPLSGSCECSPTYEGVSRACEKTNELGTCIGSEKCDSTQGFVGCNARVPSLETCNYIDDDCDGDVDEDFQTDGVYASVQACGSCTTNCDEVLPNTTETRCAVAGGVARCEVVSCAPGFSLLNPYVCAPDAGSTCQPCDAAAQCLGAGAACVELSDGKFCTTPCDEGADCGDGFVCQPVPESAQKQCVPASGSCTCDGSDTDLSRACSVTYTPPDPEQPSVTCKGLEHCTASGWGACVLQREVCDNIDNDCDGVIDQPFKTGDKYTAVDHCGSCEVSCAALSGPNAEPACDSSGSVPTCGYSCIGGAVDVNGIAEDGCECTPIAGPDLAGDSLDSNCDGIDGEVNNGIFVAKNGDDSNPGTRELPVLTIATGLTKAKAQTKRDVYVATGVYSENIILAEGVGVFGGYSPFYDDHDTVLFEVAIVGQSPDVTHLGTVTATGLGLTPNSAETVLDGVTVFGINAANLPGQNSYGIYVNGSGQRLRLSKNKVFAGPGGAGTNGARGSDGTPGANANEGGDAVGLTSACGASTSGGSGGSLTCGGSDVSGGTGGMADCPVFDSIPGASQSGGNGKGTSPGQGGTAGFDWLICAETSSPNCGGGTNCDLCKFPSGAEKTSAGNGKPGAAGVDGVAAGAATRGQASVVAGHWVAGKGGDGDDGTNGSGGGGGGAGAGVEVRGSACGAQIGDDDLGGSGGGGGSGGCAATGGTGGTGGGGSFAVFIVLAGNNAPSISGNTLQGGRGGNGGNGGPGGAGGAGGAGAEVGAAGDTFAGDDLRCAAAGGVGGDGGRGGHGAGGGGGCGGDAYGLFAFPTNQAVTAWKTSNTFISGAGGAGGTGGASLTSSQSGKAGEAGLPFSTNF
ncbi:MAG: hypothetical protein U1F43_38275 [Myxococcota bacterium]